MTVQTVVVCSKCGKPLKNIPPYLGDGDGAELFQCDNCFYPSCTQGTTIAANESLSRSKLLEVLSEELAQK